MGSQGCGGGGGGDGRERASLVRFYPLDPQSSVLAHKGLYSAGQGGERGVAGIAIMLGGCQKKDVWKEKDKKGRNFNSQ